MDSYFSAQPNTQTNYGFQTPMFSGFHNSSQGYFHNSQVKQQTLFEEEPFQFFADADSHQTGNFSPSAFTSFDIFGASPQRQSHFDKDRVYDNFNFDLDFTSFRTEAEPTEAFKRPVYHCKPSTAGAFKDSDQDFVAENEFQAHQTLPNTPGESVQCEQQEQEKSAPVTNNGLKGWSEDDEKLLKKLAVQYKFDWKKIAKKFDNKKYTPHFLKMRYKGYDEGPVPKRVKFTHEEDVLIAKYFNEYGVDWEKMVSHFPNRTPIMLKNRYYSHIRKNRKLEGLLKEIEEHESNYVSQCMSQIGDNAELSAISIEDNYSQFQTEVFIDLSEKKSSGKKSNKKDKVAQLKAQLKSMKSLYVAAYRELSKLRGNQEAI